MNRLRTGSFANFIVEPFRQPSPEAFAVHGPRLLVAVDFDCRKTLRIVAAGRVEQLQRRLPARPGRPLAMDGRRLPVRRRCPQFAGDAFQLRRHGFSVDAPPPLAQPGQKFLSSAGLREHRIAGAGLDVFSSEPLPGLPFPAGTRKRYTVSARDRPHPRVCFRDTSISACRNVVAVSRESRRLTLSTGRCWNVRKCRKSWRGISGERDRSSPR